MNLIRVNDLIINLDQIKSVTREDGVVTLFYAIPNEGNRHEDVGGEAAKKLWSYLTKNSGFSFGPM